METKVKPQYKEGKVAEAIEGQTAKLPSDFFLWSALSSMGISLLLRLFRRRSESIFVAQWAAPLLIMGLYNKLVKLEGHGA